MYHGWELAAIITAALIIGFIFGFSAALGMRRG